MNSGPTDNRNFHGMHQGHGGPHNFPPPMPNMGGPPMPPNPNGMPPPWMQPPPPPMSQGPAPPGHHMGEYNLQTCQPVRILRSGHAFWPQSTQVRFVTLNYAKTWWRLCARTVAYLNQATAMKEDFDQSERWVHSPSSKWDDWQMRRPIIKKRLQIDSKTKSRSVSYLFTPAVWFLKRGQHTRYLQLR